MNKAALHLALTMFGLMALPPVTANERPDRSRSKEPGIQLTSEHMEAVNRQRRIIFQDNVMCSNTPFTMERVGPSQLEETIAYYMARLDAEPNQIDSVWHEWGEGNIAAWPSKVLSPPPPGYFQQWWEAGIDPVRLLLDECRKRSREVFFSYRINGSDNEYFQEQGTVTLPPMKAEHPDWLIKAWHRYGYWNFANPEVRDYRVRILREVAENYDFDGISIDFARVPILLPAGEQWLRRDSITDFMRQLRLTLLEIEEQRGRPLLLAARVPENLMGCHFDGLDVETWARERLVDIFVPGCRSSDVDVAAFHRITAGAGIKVYPSFDDHHSSDGYYEPSVEVWRGVFANWWSQGAEGAHTFNLVFSSPEAAGKLDLPKWAHADHWQRQWQIWQEIGNPETLKHKDKIFYVQRRGGGHGPRVVPNPEDWNTPRHMYFNTNMFAPLPATLANNGKSDTLLTLNVADDVSADAKHVQAITLHLVLSDPAADGLPEAKRIQPVTVATKAHPGGRLLNSPPANGIDEHIEVRINNLLLSRARIEKGWLAFPVEPQQLAVGDNLVGVRVTERPTDAEAEISIEKLELHVDYR